MRKITALKNKVMSFPRRRESTQSWTPAFARVTGVGNRGFTLIELLISISIIALLSSIIVAVLIDTRTGAQNNKRNELARQYVSALEIHFSEFGTFPTGGCTDAGACASIVYTCLGDNYPNNDCYVWGDHTENAIVNTQLRPFFSGLPSLLDPVRNGVTTFTGAAYGCLDANTCKGYRLSWVLEGEGNDAQCFGGAEETDLGPLSICTFTGGITN